MPTIFGNYTPREYDALRRMNEHIKERIAMHIVLSGDDSMILRGAIGHSQADKYIERAIREARLGGHTPAPPYDKL
jgi:hypothetical protein